MLQMKFDYDLLSGLRDIHVWKCGWTDRLTPAQSHPISSSWAFGSGELKISELKWTRKHKSLFWIFYVFVLSCVCYVFVRVCLYVLCGHLLGKGWPLGSRLWCLLWVCHLPIGILGQVWYLIVSIPDICTLPYLSLVGLCMVLNTPWKFHEIRWLCVPYLQFSGGYMDLALYERKQK